MSAKANSGGAATATSTTTASEQPPNELVDVVGFEEDDEFEEFEEDGKCWDLTQVNLDTDDAFN